MHNNGKGLKYRQKQHEEEDARVHAIGRHEKETAWVGAALILYDKNGYEYPCDFNEKGELIVAFKSKRKPNG